MGLKSSGFGPSTVSYDTGLGFAKFNTIDNNASVAGKVNQARQKLPQEKSISESQARDRAGHARHRLLKALGEQYARDDAGASNESAVATRETVRTMLFGKASRHFPASTSRACMDLSESICNALAVEHQASEKTGDVTRLFWAMAAALGTKSEQKNIVDAMEVLQCLRHMDLPGILRGAPFPAKPDGGPYDRSIQNAAWKTAYAMGTSGLGMETLKQIANNLAPAPATLIQAPDSRKLRNFLNAAHVVMTQNDRLDPSPAALLRHVGSPGNRSLAGDALQADHRMLTEPEMTWAELAGATEADRSARSQPMWAYASSAVRNGFESDAAGSPLDKACQRSKKMTEHWVPRAIDRFNNSATAVTSGFGNILAPTKNKSPLSPLLNITQVKQIHCFDESYAVKDALTELSKFTRSVARQQWERLLGSSEAGGEERQELGKTIIDSLIKTAILETWDEERGLRQRHQGRPMQQHEIAKIEDKLDTFEQALLESGSDWAKECLQLQQDVIVLGQLKRKFWELFPQRPEPLQLSSETLSAWAVKAIEKLSPTGVTLTGSTLDKAGKVLWMDEPGDRDKLDQALARMSGKVAHVRIDDYVDDGGKLDRERLAHYMGAMSKRQAVASKISASAGGTIGLDSRNFLTATLQNTLYTVQQTAIPISVGAQFIPTFGKEGTVSVAMPGEGVTLEMTSRQRGVIQLGVSAFAGYHLAGPALGEKNLGATVGGSGSLYASYAEERKNGVMIRIGRNGRLDEEGRAARAPGFAGDPQAKMDFDPFIRVSVEGLSQVDRNIGFTSPLQKILSLSDEVSVTYLNSNDNRDRKIKLGGTANAAAILDYGPGRLGISAGITGEATLQPEAWQVYAERTGATRIERETAVQAFKIAPSLALNGAAVHAYDSSAPFKNSGVGADSALASLDMFHRSMMVQRTLVYDGADVTPGSHLHYKHQTADGFAQSVLNRIDLWSHTELKSIVNNLSQVSKSRIAFPDDWPKFPGPGKAYQGGSPEFMDLVRESRETIRQHVESARRNAEPNKTFSEWYQPSPATAREISKHKANARLAFLAGAHDEARKEEAAAARIAHNPDSWDPVLLFSLTNSSEATTTGLPDIGLILKSYKGLTVANAETMT